MSFEWRGTLSLILLSVCGACSMAATTPQFVVTPSFPIGLGPVSIATADFDGDNRQDIAVASFGYIHVRLGDGAGGFAAPKILAVPDALTGYPAELTGIAAGDFNGDHLPDLVVSDVSGGFHILLNNGLGSFAKAVHVPGGVNARAIAVADFNHDGHLDVAIADPMRGLLVFLGHGDGTFAIRILSPAKGLKRLLAGDVNGDGNLDLIAGTSSVDNGAISAVQVFLGLGNGHLQALTMTSFPGKLDSIGLGDFNSDGKMDLAIGLFTRERSTGRILLLNGLGDGTFAGPGTTVDSGPGDPFGMVVGDFNRDGHLDMMVGTFDPLFRWAPGFGNTANVILGKGDGTFQAPKLFNVGFGPDAIALGDFNNDGNMDAAVANSRSNSVSILLSTANGIFEGARAYAPGQNPTLILSGDLDGDKNLDLVTVNKGFFTGQPGYSVFKGNGDGTFQPAVNVSIGITEPISGILADFNGDKIPDLAIGDYSTGAVYLYLGNGDATFSFLTSYPVGFAPGFMTNADLDKDGNQDLVVVNQSGNTISVLLGTGGGFFQAPVTYAVGSSPTSVAVADLNLDGHLDLAVSNGSDNTLSILLGTGAGTFSNAGTVATGRGPHDVRSSDLNRDGAPDLIVANFGDNTVSVFLNNGLGGFPKRADYAVAHSPVDQPNSYFIVAKDLDGDGAPDLAVGGSTTTVLYNNGSGLFEAGQKYDVVELTLTSGDFNHDGFADLAGSQYWPGNVAVLINTKH